MALAQHVETAPSGIANSCLRSLDSGTELLSSSSQGLGTLEVKNGTQQDAVVGLRKDDLYLHAFYVKAGESWILQSVAEGTYRVLFTTGSDWDGPSRQFMCNASVSEFEKELPFEEVDKGDRISYASFSLTLHTVTRGNARIRPLPLQALGLPPLTGE